MPKISIIMPVYNKQNYLRRSLDSVLDQDFDDFELIAIDDGSTDDSLKILEDYKTKDDRIRVIHTENHGVSHARNTGLDNAKGEWIQFLDGDDLIEKEYLEKCQEIINGRSPDIVFSSFTMEDINGIQAKTVETPLEGERDGKDLQSSFLKYQPESGFYGYISNKLFKRSLAERSKARFNEKLKLAEDLDFFVQIYPTVEKVCYLPENSFVYLQTDENYSHDTDIDYLGQLSVYKRIRQWMIDSGSYSRYKTDVDGNVCRYAAFAVFDAAARREDIGDICNVLLSDDTVRSCLNSDYVTNKVHKKIIDSLQRNEITNLNRYLAFREKLKKLLGRS